ncbi:DUF3127 domain-containing protein [Limnobacter sp.]|uniref:DUF3127 domain-containing protein n=1 Tax=Limnobacter sp. TaxID=2003368 RepID=UPI0025B9FA8D|nr:DUF3127 domain-containing protein [Limnobacter sp.]
MNHFKLIIYNMEPKNDTRTQVQGSIVEVGEIQHFSKTSKQGLYIKLHDDKYDKHLYLTAFGDKTDLIGDIQVGTDVWAVFYPTSNRWEKEGRVMYFTDLRIIDLRVAGQFDGDQPREAEPMPAVSSTPPPSNASVEKRNEFTASRPVAEDDEVPF